MKRFIATAISIALTACSSTGIVPMNAGTYLIAKKEAQVGIGPPIVIKGEVYAEANAHCAKQGKQIETVDYQETGSHLGRMAAVSLEFKCVDR
jgi:putative hemolysin